MATRKDVIAKDNSQDWNGKAYEHTVYSEQRIWYRNSIKARLCTTAKDCVTVGSEEARFKHQLSSLCNGCTKTAFPSGTTDMYTGHREIGEPKGSLSLGFLYNSVHLDIFLLCNQLVSEPSGRAGGGVGNSPKPGVNHQSLCNQKIMLKSWYKMPHITSWTHGYKTTLLISMFHVLTIGQGWAGTGLTLARQHRPISGLLELTQHRCNKLHNSYFYIKQIICATVYVSVSNRLS